MEEKSSEFYTEPASFGAKQKPKEKIDILKIEILVNDRFVPIPLPQPREEIRMKDQVVEVKKCATTLKKSTEDDMLRGDVYDYEVEDADFDIDMMWKQLDVEANVARNMELDHCHNERHINYSPPNAQTEGKPAQLKRKCNEIESESAKKKKPVNSEPGQQTHANKKEVGKQPTTEKSKAEPVNSEPGQQNHANKKKEEKQPTSEKSKAEPVNSEPGQQKHTNKKEEGKQPTKEKSKAEFLKTLQQKADAYIVVNAGQPNERKIPDITVPEGFGIGPGEVSVVSYDLDGRALEETSRTLVEALEIDDEEVKAVKVVKRNAQTVEEDSSSEEEDEEKQKDSSEKEKPAKETQPEEMRKKWLNEPLNETPSCNVIEFLESMYKRQKAELKELKRNIELAKILAAINAPK